MNIAWIGTGVMGGFMLQHLHGAGHKLYLYNRTKEKALAYQKEGIIVCDTIGECVEHAQIVCTMVGYPKDVEEVYQEIFQKAKPETICIDFTTSSPLLAKQLYEQGKTFHIHVCDAPVSGGDSGAKNATLSIMFGGEQALFEQLSSLLEHFGTPHYMGEAGNGQHTKACNQICVAGAVSAMCEALYYAKRNDLDVETVLEAIKGGAAGSWQLEHTAPRVLQKDYAPGFYIKHFVKDMHIVQDVMQAHGEHLDMLDCVCHVYETLEKQGYGEDGTQAIMRYYEAKEE